MGLEDAAKKIGIKPERLREWENEGGQRPSVPQLRNAAQAYKRPLAVFFMSVPPVEPAALRDFRGLRGLDIPSASPALAFATRRARRRRSVAVELLDESGAQPPAFPLRASIRDDPEAVAASIRTWLGIRLEEQARWRTESEALNGWIAALEARDVLVFQVNDVPLDEMRGFSISESVLPVITLNAGTIRSPEEVLHELAAGTDGLDETLKQRAGLFVPLDDATMIAVGQVTDGCNGFVDPASDRNRGAPFVVALAMVQGGTVVTKERARRRPTGRPRIPDACAQFNVPCMHWFDFLRMIGWQL